MKLKISLLLSKIKNDSSTLKLSPFWSKLMLENHYWWKVANLQKRILHFYVSLLERIPYFSLLLIQTGPWKCYFICNFFLSHYPGFQPKDMVNLSMISAESCNLFHGEKRPMFPPTAYSYTEQSLKLWSPLVHAE